jgi:hypothetical protein
MNRIRISDVGCRALDGGNRTHSEDRSAGLGCDLADRVLCSPAIDEDADNGEDAEGREGWACGAHLGFPSGFDFRSFSFGR